jgi:hypothetical protein
LDRSSSNQNRQDSPFYELKHLLVDLVFPFADVLAHLVTSWVDLSGIQDCGKEEVEQVAQTTYNGMRCLGSFLLGPHVP